jgi:hypothetical protein
MQRKPRSAARLFSPGWNHLRPNRAAIPNLRRQIEFVAVILLQKKGQNRFERGVPIVTG